MTGAPDPGPPPLPPAPTEEEEAGRRLVAGATVGFGIFVVLGGFALALSSVIPKAFSLMTLVVGIASVWIGRRLAASKS